jgi:glycosyltransferase involved in cell wall biosynthesis
MPFFSIIIPTYNRAELIKPTLDSVLSLSYQYWECTVVDDGSTDHTKEVVQAYCEKDDRFQYVYQENAERSAARNKGIRHSKGAWVCFLDSDDLYEPTYLEELHNFISENTIPSLIISDFSILQDTTRKNQDIPLIDERNLADWLFAYPVSPSRVCVHRDILKEFTFREDICIVEDTVLWVSISTKYPVHQLKKPLVIYRSHMDNSVAQFSGSVFRRHAGLKLFFQDALARSVSRKMKKRVLSETEFRIAEYHSFHKKTMKALFYCVKSIFTDFKHEQRKMRLFFVLGLIPGFHLIWRKIKS